ncbi:Hint domain-containing protein [Antarctobacter heliothermus]|uniref:Hint domain-containing protein n=1 Tax=Antarctobacter heliothermus TaxID=74033 RepID=A0A239GJF4_9RHOB|nr:Hint domain-containing protein [Antarctobacter heliothermus]SNS68623.1 Hint domain-containing protein [Antarctobacter heliothermus]
MGSFSATHAITYNSGNFVSPVQGFTDTITDGDADTTFETGDSYFAASIGDTLVYQGTAVVDGVTWPVFSYQSFPSFFTIIMDQAPVAVPPTLGPVFTSGDTFNNACFAAGTQISTPSGDVAVETLKIGDRILTADGRDIAVKWLGHLSYKPMLCSAAHLPVRLRAGALGNDLPHSDLTVTADHGMVLDGLVINASALVNGSTIDWAPLVDLPDTFTVYHVETENHDVILANGAPSETFIDYRDRRAFDNFDEYLKLYGCERIIPEMLKPRISSQRHMPAPLRTRLNIARATGHRSVA